ncbi:MAG: SGNH/GDSL hydrolase family protein [Planctomycetota bacterium]
MNRRALGALLLLLAAATAAGDKKKEPKAAAPLFHHVLFIGNSYTSNHDLPEMVAGLVEAANLPTKLQVESDTADAATLENHWGTRSVRDSIRSRAWRYVVLQEQSLRPLERPDRMEKYAKLLAAEIRKRGAKPVLFLTWAREEKPKTQKELNRVYYKVAEAVKGTVVPVGPAWARVRRERPRLKLFAYDGSHPTRAGTYLAACVFYAVLTGRSPVGLPGKVVYRNRTLVELKPAVANYLQKAAWKTAIS